MKIAGLIVGIVSFVMSLISAFFWKTPVVQIIIVVLAVAGIVLSALAGKKEKSGAATTGLVFSIIATVFGTLFLVSCVACVSCAAKTTGLSLKEFYELARSGVAALR